MIGRFKHSVLRAFRAYLQQSRGEEYVLSDLSTNPKIEFKFRKIKVEVKDPKLQVPAKAGCWAVPSRDSA